MENDNFKKKIIVILGPTASGKSDLAIKLAQKFNGEIISADSRQVYKGLDIGSGKIKKEEMKEIPHYLLDVASPKRRFSVSKYQKLSLKAIEKIFKKNKIPIICGGSGFYIQSVIDGIKIPEVKPNYKLRKELSKKTPDELYQMLKKLDKNRAESIDRKNSRRLIRAIEIAIELKKVPKLEKHPLPYPVLILGIKKEKNELKKLIKKRLLKRLDEGMVDEVKNLYKNNVSFKKLEEFGLEYRYIAFYLQGKMTYDEMVKSLQKEIEHYAKRQMT
ncbi:MAG TPA: tRNA (adenosine(37)-N6)-dimethylallyltransferase MiaA, partial [Candidatus Pacearchaeota archaeon]|nr:tRNA (adenosine(37)-N6)-dimethylallyltransferase MiaA [Candidatus Pacearchaeota archaeon]